MDLSSPVAPEIVAARRTGRRVALSVFVCFVIAFIGVCAFEIICAAFGLAPGGKALEGPANPACVAATRAAVAALDAASLDALKRSMDSVTAASGDDSAGEPWSPTDRKPWAGAEGQAQSACQGTAADEQVFAAYVHLRTAQEGALRRTLQETFPLRRHIAKYFSP